MTHKLNILIAGAGLGGLAAAVALSIDGHHVTVLEAASEFGEIGAGIQVTPNVTRILHRWDLAESLGRYGCTPETVTQLRWDDGTQLTRFSINRDGRMEREYGYKYYHIHRKDLHRMLLETAQRRGAIVKVNCGVVHYTTSSEGLPQAVVTQDGFRHSADLIIAADGCRSTLGRFVVGSEIKAEPTGDSAYRALLTRQQVQDAELEIPELASGSVVWLGPGSHVVGYYVDGGRLYNLVIVVPTGDEVNEESWKLPGKMERLRAHFAGWDPRLRRLLSKIDKSLLWNLYDRGGLSQWVHPVGNLVLIGDAAHPMLPYVAQGAASAVEDAAALAECLKLVSEKCSLREALTMYARLRIPRTSAMRTAGQKNRVYFHLPDGPEQQQRDADLQKYDETGETPNQLNNSKVLAAMYGYDIVKDVRREYEANQAI
ncbi:hypothetical protein BJY01DRAFT_240602 [Aspergillus pseudoustus]|uniref:FAD-binding domain-containing protein n=1 Tax=Aspergillus pseudoustus TaxID=1810923 RepID=A0ABR4IPF6_9EURO